MRNGSKFVVRHADDEVLQDTPFYIRWAIISMRFDVWMSNIVVEDAFEGKLKGREGIWIVHRAAVCKVSFRRSDNPCLYVLRTLVSGVWMMMSWQRDTQYSTFSGPWKSNLHLQPSFIIINNKCLPLPRSNGLLLLLLLLLDFFSCLEMTIDTKTYSSYFISRLF